MVANDYVSNANARTLFALQYGLNSIASAPDLTEIRVTSSDYQTFIALPRVEGLKLRNKMLRFLFDWYSLLPQEPIGYPDLILNIHADEKQLEQWMSILNQSGLIVRAGTKEYKSEMGFGFSTGVFRLNPEKEDNAKRLLGLSDEQPDSRGGGISRVFLSYNTKDKDLAGRIASILRSRYRTEVFLAHEVLKVSQEWRGAILEELAKCDCLIALVTKNYRSSKWTDQEVGNAIGRGKKVMSIFHQRKLHGFLEMYQGVPLIDDLESLVTRIGNDLGLAKMIAN
jgi:hypothetical protein